MCEVTSEERAYLKSEVARRSLIRATSPPQLPVVPREIRRRGEYQDASYRGYWMRIYATKVIVYGAGTEATLRSVPKARAFIRSLHKEAALENRDASPPAAPQPCPPASLSSSAAVHVQPDDKRDDGLSGSAALEPSAVA